MSFDLRPDDLLRWYLESGVDEAIGEIAIDRFAAPIRAPVPVSAPALVVAQARHVAPHPEFSTAHLASACSTLDELHKALTDFEGLPIKKTANSTVFADGNPEAAVMIIGDVPGTDDDSQGVPFAGKVGKLLDGMLESIGLDRKTAYFTNVIPWRLLENRKPSPEEVALCLPFVARHVELVDPKMLILLGGAASSAILARHDSISRLRGRWHDYASPGLPCPVPAMATFHPAYLLRTPDAKRWAWKDLLMVRKRLDELGL